MIKLMCDGHSAKSIIETCNSCNCFEVGWMDRHRNEHPDQPLLFTENEGWIQFWEEAIDICDNIKSSLFFC